MIAMLKQRAVKIGLSLTTGKIDLTTSDIFIPPEGYERPLSLDQTCEIKSSLPVDPRGTMLDWHNQPIQDGVIINARVASGMSNLKAEASSPIRIILNDQQLRALAIDLVKTSMIRGIQF